MGEEKSNKIRIRVILITIIISIIVLIGYIMDYENMNISYGTYKWRDPFNGEHEMVITSTTIDNFKYEVDNTTIEKDRKYYYISIYSKDNKVLHKYKLMILKGNNNYIRLQNIDDFNGLDLYKW